MADYKEGIVESIKIATLEKQIEILEKLGLSKDEILAKMSDENSDILTIILNKIDSLYEQEEQALVEQLARTLLANQSEASLKYVLEHELVGKVFKHILKSDNDKFDKIIGIEQLFSNNRAHEEVLLNESLRTVLLNSTVYSKKVSTSIHFSSILTSDILAKYILKSHVCAKYMVSNSETIRVIASNDSAFDVVLNDEEIMLIFANTNSAIRTLAEKEEWLIKISESKIAMYALLHCDYSTSVYIHNTEITCLALVVSSTSITSFNFADGTSVRDIIPTYHITDIGLISHYTYGNLLREFPKIATKVWGRFKNKDAAKIHVYKII